MTEKDISAVNTEANGDNGGEKTRGFDYDGYYKDLIECFFYPLLKRAIPKLYDIADITVKPRLLDKEFRDLLNTGDPEIHTSPHFADFVFEVPTKDGKNQWILCHVETQGRGGTNLSERMFFYMCLIYGHYRRMPVGLALITDGHRKEERCFSYNHFDLKTLYEYYNVILADLDDGELQASDNPIDLALYAAKCASRAKEELQKYTYLRRLTDLLTERGWGVNEKRDLMLFMIRIINLQDKMLQEQYWEHRLEVAEEGRLMYETFLQEAAERIAERRGMEKGLEKGMEKGIDKVVKKLIARGYSPEAISEIVEWPVERIRSLAN